MFCRHFNINSNSLSHSQQSTTSPYPKPDYFSSCFSHRFLNLNSYICLHFPSCIFIQPSPPKYCVQFFCPPHVPHAPSSHPVYCMTGITFGNVWKSLIYSLRSFPQVPFTSSSPQASSAASPSQTPSNFAIPFTLETSSHKTITQRAKFYFCIL